MVLLCNNKIVWYNVVGGFMKKEEKTNSDYFTTEEGKFIKHQSKKIRIEGILCIALGLIYLLFNIYKKEDWYMYIITISLFVFGSYFLYKSYSIKNFKKKIYDYKKNNAQEK